MLAGIRICNQVESKEKLLKQGDCRGKVLIWVTLWLYYGTQLDFTSPF